MFVSKQIKFLLMLLAFFLMSHAYSIDHKYGQIDQSFKHNTLIQKVTVSHRGKALGTCTGTFISKTAFVTAKHCIKKAEENLKFKSELEQIDFTIVDLNIVSTAYHLVCPGDNNQCLDLMFIEFPKQEDLIDLFEIDLIYYSTHSFDDMEFKLLGRGISNWSKKKSDSILRESMGMILSQKNKKNKLIYSGEFTGIRSGDSGGPLINESTIYGVASHGSHNSGHYSFAHFQAIDLNDIDFTTKYDMSVLSQKLKVSHQYECVCSIVEFTTSNGMTSNPRWETLSETSMTIPVPFYSGSEDRCSLLSGNVYPTWTTKKSINCSK